MKQDVLTQAGDWVLELSSPDVSVERIALWQQWMAGSADRVQAFDELQRVWNVGGEIPREAVPLLTTSDRHYFVRGTSWHQWGAVAASVVCALLLSWFWVAYRGTSQIVETGVGVHRDVTLTDGSVVAVGADSKLRVALNREARSIELERGEAFFTVAKDARRPFEVRVAGVSVRALGTAFNVRRAGSRVVVSVSDGLVAVGDTRVASGQQLVLEPPAAAKPSRGRTADVPAPPKVQAVSPKAVAGWREGRLSYSGEPLSFVVADVNRYVEHPIVIGDASVADLRVTGSVSEQNVAEWVGSLESALPVRVVAGADGGWVIEGR